MCLIFYSIALNLNNFIIKYYMNSRSQGPGKQHSVLVSGFFSTSLLLASQAVRTKSHQYKIVLNVLNLVPVIWCFWIRCHSVRVVSSSALWPSVVNGSEWRVFGSKGRVSLPTCRTRQQWIRFIKGRAQSWLVPWPFGPALLPQIESLLF